MAYTIEKTDNTILTIVEDGTIDNSTNIKLVGKNYSGYGEVQNENFVALLENFASANQPSRPIAGQLWFDASAKSVKLYDGNAGGVFVPLATMHKGPLPSSVTLSASNVKDGDAWWDDVTNQLYMYTGDSFVLVGPRESQSSITDVVDRVVYDNLLGDPDPSPSDHAHTVLLGYADNAVVFIISKDEFTLDDSNSIAGFDRIRKGITLVNTQVSQNGVTSDNFQLHGTASNAARLSGVDAIEFTQRSNAVFTNVVAISSNSGLTIGSSSQLSLRAAGNNGEIVASATGGEIHLGVKNSSGQDVILTKVTAQGVLPAADNSSSIGSSILRWNEVHATALRGTADRSLTLLSDGEFRTATKTNSNNTIVRRDSVGDVYATVFRGVATNANLSDRANKMRILDTADTYVDSSVAIAANTIPVRDSSGNISAAQFNGLASRAVTMQVPSGTPGVFDYRTASVASASNQPNTVVIRDNQGRLYSQSFIGSLLGSAQTADKLTTPIQLSLTGDIEGSVQFDGSQNVSISTNVTVDAVALGTNTTGNYVQNVATYASDPYVTVYVNNVANGVASEAASVEIALRATTSTANGTVVARDDQGDFAAHIITADDKFVGNVNQAGTTKNGWFNQLTVGTLLFSGAGALPIVSGGTGATTPATARTSLSVYSKAETDSQINTSPTFIKKAGDTATGFIALHADPTQEMHAVTKNYVDTVAAPVSIVSYFASNTAPTGWVKANGAALSRATYARLFAKIGVTFGAGNGSTTFNVPDLRGEFIRGWDDGRGVDANRAFGSFQADMFKSHTHELWGNDRGTFNGQLFAAGLYQDDAERAASDVGAIRNTGGAETRPRNIALLACIKY